MNENLVPQNMRTKEEQKEIARMGGVASGEARRRKRDIRLALELLLEKELTDSKGNKVTGAEAISLKQFEKALKGDTKAFEVVRDSVGQKPVERVEQVNIDASARALDEYFQRTSDSVTEE